MKSAETGSATWRIPQTQASLVKPAYIVRCKCDCWRLCRESESKSWITYLTYTLGPHFSDFWRKGGLGKVVTPWRQYPK